MSSPLPAVRGYSDRVNHALAFAAKHHDQQVRKGTRAPYPTEPASVAIILTRYGQPEHTVIAGILHDVVQDSASDGAMSSSLLHERVAEKFGADLLATVLTVTLRRLDDDGIELSSDERREDLLWRLDRAAPDGQWVFAARALHAVASLVSDLRRTVDPTAVWSRSAGGRQATLHWHERVCERLHEVGFDAPIMRELDGVVRELTDLARQPV
jgi:hypothetical protein